MQEAVNFFVSQIAGHGVQHAVICPGSRNAPLTLAFSRHPLIQCHVLVDERSAAFTALGIAVQTLKPVVILCTSGTAVLNLYPAVCEAWYSQIPLLVITADRPPELIDQWDGQCIHQEGIFEKHILGSFSFDPANSSAHMEDAIRLCYTPKRGPVHINVPLSEPLYEGKYTPFTYPPVTEEFPELPVLQNLPDSLPAKHVLVFAGADADGARLSEIVALLSESRKVVVLTDAISGLHPYNTSLYWDAICTLASDSIKQTLQPELLITIGKFTISKGLKTFLRSFKPKAHWHVSPNHTLADPFQTAPVEIACDEWVFLKWLHSRSETLPTTYCTSWVGYGEACSRAIKGLMDHSDFNEFWAVDHLLQQIEAGQTLHIANSMPVRYVSFLISRASQLKLYANRGTSGIDGSTSTAAGASMVSNQSVYLITGDLSFFYDINGLWNPYLKPNFKIIVLNNRGGGIFRLIEGPSDLPERETYFTATGHVNRQRCKWMAEAFGCAYFEAAQKGDLNEVWPRFRQEDKKPAILELQFEPDATVAFYKQFKALKIETHYI